MVIAIVLPELRFTRANNKTILVFADVSQRLAGVANNVYPDQMPPSVISDLGVHCFYRRICL